MLSKLKYLCIFFVLSGFSLAMAADTCKKAPEEWLFVIIAERFELEGDTLTLFKKSDDLMAFTDRPYRKQMRLNFQELVESWDKGANSFKDDPPNAYLTWEDTSGDKSRIEARELILFDIDVTSAQEHVYKFKVRDWKTTNPRIKGQHPQLLIDSGALQWIGNIFGAIGQAFSE